MPVDGMDFLRMLMSAGGPGPGPALTELLRRRSEGGASKKARRAGDDDASSPPAPKASPESSLAAAKCVKCSKFLRRGKIILSKCCNTLFCQDCAVRPGGARDLCSCGAVLQDGPPAILALLEQTIAGLLVHCPDCDAPAPIEHECELKCDAIFITQLPGFSDEVKCGRRHTRDAARACPVRIAALLNAERTIVARVMGAALANIVGAANGCDAVKGFSFVSEDHQKALEAAGVDETDIIVSPAPPNETLMFWFGRTRCNGELIRTEPSLMTACSRMRIAERYCLSSVLAYMEEKGFITSRENVLRNIRGNVEAFNSGIAEGGDMLEYDDVVYARGRTDYCARARALDEAVAQGAGRGAIRDAFERLVVCMPQ